MVDNKVRSGNPIGLENPGNICYANALIQQFFRIKSFRHNILQIPLEKELRVEENVLYQLQVNLYIIYIAAIWRTYTKQAEQNDSNWVDPEHKRY